MAAGRLEFYLNLNQWRCCWQLIICLQEEQILQEIFYHQVQVTVASRVQSSAPGGGGFKLSERWVQEFKTGDKRLQIILRK